MNYFYNKKKFSYFGKNLSHQLHFQPFLRLNLCCSLRLPCQRHSPPRPRVLPPPHPHPPLSLGVPPLETRLLGLIVSTTSSLPGLTRGKCSPHARPPPSVPYPAEARAPRPAPHLLLPRSFPQTRHGELCLWLVPMAGSTADLVKAVYL